MVYEVQSTLLLCSSRGRFQVYHYSDFMVMLAKRPPIRSKEDRYAVRVIHIRVRCRGISPANALCPGVSRFAKAQVALVIR